LELHENKKPELQEIPATYRKWKVDRKYEEEK